MSNVALLIEVDLIDPFARKLKRSDIKERDLEGTKDNAMKVLYLALKGINNCKFLKSGNRLVLMFDEFKNIDNVFFFVEQAVKRIVAKMNDENWDLRVYISAEAYEDSANFRKDVLASLEKLIVLKQKNQIVCFGNLKMRYEMKPERLYDIELLHGTYEIDGGTDVFVLVKKN